jgi:hypothetical protein
MSVRCVVVVAAFAAGLPPSSAIARDAFDRYGASWRTVALPPVGAGSFGVSADFLPDGRIIAVTGRSVLLESAPGSQVFAPVATLDAGQVGAGTDPSFLHVSPGGTSVAIGAGFGKPVVVFRVDALGAPGSPTDLAPGVNASYFDLGHFDGAWRDEQHLAITAGDFGSPSYVTMLDVASSVGSPINPVIVQGIAGASAGIAFDHAGRLYTGNGFDLDPSSGSDTGTIRAFDPVEWLGGAVNFETGGVLIGDVLSAGSLLFDADGNLVIGGGEFPGDAGYLGVLRSDAITDALAGHGPVDPSDPLQLRRLDPFGNATGYFGAAYNPVTGELFAATGTTWYGTIPAPGSALALTIAGVLGARRRRHA